MELGIDFYRCTKGFDKKCKKYKVTGNTNVEKRVNKIRRVVSEVSFFVGDPVSVLLNCIFISLRERFFLARVCLYLIIFSNYKKKLKKNMTLQTR